jgi:membrane protein implicated in regulation of membrane protease activity
MFDLSTISTLIVPTILILCLCVGYIIKNLVPNDNINRFIPAILAVVAIAAGVFSAVSTGTDITLDLIVGALVSGLASTAVYEQFKNLLGGSSSIATATEAAAEETATAEEVVIVNDKPAE